VIYFYLPLSAFISMQVKACAARSDACVHSCARGTFSHPGPFTRKTEAFSNKTEVSGTTVSARASTRPTTLQLGMGLRLPKGSATRCPPPPGQHRREAGAAELWPAVLGLGQATIPSAGADPRRPHSLAISPGPGQPKGPARRGRRAAPQQSGTSPPASRALGAQPVPVDALAPQGCCRQTLSASAPAVLCRW